MDLYDNKKLLIKLLADRLDWYTFHTSYFPEDEVVAIATLLQILEPDKDTQPLPPKIK